MKLIHLQNLHFRVHVNYWGFNGITSTFFQSLELHCIFCSKITIGTGTCRKIYLTSWLLPALDFFRSHPEYAKPCIPSMNPNLNPKKKIPRSNGSEPGTKKQHESRSRNRQISFKARPLKKSKQIRSEPPEGFHLSDPRRSDRSSKIGAYLIYEKDLKITDLEKFESHLRKKTTSSVLNLQICESIHSCFNLFQVASEKFSFTKKIVEHPQNSDEPDLFQASSKKRKSLKSYPKIIIIYNKISKRIPWQTR